MPLAAELERRERTAWRQLLSCPAVLETAIRELESQVADPASATLEELCRAIQSAGEIRGAGCRLAEELVRLDRARRIRRVLVARNERATARAALASARNGIRGRADGRHGRRRDRASDAAWRSCADRVLRAEASAAAVREDFSAAHLRLVVTIARRFRGHGVPLSDLVELGNLVLGRAVDRFDRRSGFRFSTLASWWTVTSIRRALLHDGQTVRVPIQLIETSRHVRQLHRAVPAARPASVRSGGRRGRRAAAMLHDHSDEAVPLLP